MSDSRTQLFLAFLSPLSNLFGGFLRLRIFGKFKIVQKGWGEGDFCQGELNKPFPKSPSVPHLRQPRSWGNGIQVSTLQNSLHFLLEPTMNLSSILFIKVCCIARALFCKSVWSAGTEPLILSCQLQTRI